MRPKSAANIGSKTHAYTMPVRKAYKAALAEKSGLSRPPITPLRTNNKLNNLRQSVAFPSSTKHLKNLSLAEADSSILSPSKIQTPNKSIMKQLGVRGGSSTYNTSIKKNRENMKLNEKDLGKPS